MLVLQQIDVLPAGAHFYIVDKDTYKITVSGKKSQIDNSIIFRSAKDADLYNKVYSIFHVTGIDITIDSNKPSEIIWIIKVR